MQPPYKNVATALLFAVLLGPVGLLYSSFWGGVIMMIIGMIVVSAQFPFPILIWWMCCSVWAVRAVEKYNHRISVRL